jgi:hypothetical protein
VLFDRAKISKSTTKTETRYTADYNNPALAFAKHVNVEGLRKVEGTVIICRAF